MISDDTARQPGDVLVRPNFNSNRSVKGPSSGRNYGVQGHHRPFWMAGEDYELRRRDFERDTMLESQQPPLDVPFAAAGPETPLITVIIPVAPYHREVVERAIASVRAQTVPCAVETVYDDEGQGAGWARNQGLQRAASPFVVFLDADDHLLPAFAERTLKAFDGVSYVYTDWMTNDVKKTAPDCPYAAPRQWHAVTCLVPTAWAQQVGGFSEDLPGAEDADFFLRLIDYGYCGAHVAEHLFHYARGGKRSSEFRQRDDYNALITEIADDKRTKAAQACCNRPRQRERHENALNQPKAGDVLAVALWSGRHQLKNTASGRVYPRAVGGQRLYVDPQDAQAHPTMLRMIDMALLARINMVLRQPVQRYDPSIAERAPQAHAVPDFDRLIKAADYLFAGEAAQPAPKSVAVIEFPSSQNAGGYLIDRETLNSAAPYIPKTGYCVEVGVGNVGFYSIEFARLGHKTIAIDPIISDEFRAAIEASGLEKKIEIVEAALMETGGKVEFYVADDDKNVSSLRADHWGVRKSQKTRVKAITYDQVVAMGSKAKRPPVCLKLDIEGYESRVLPIIALNPPKVLIYEIGGGDVKKRKVKGWSKENMAADSAAFETLREAGYKAGAYVDANLQRVFPFEMADVPVGGYEQLFAPESGFGNLVLRW